MSTLNARIAKALAPHIAAANRNNHDWHLSYNSRTATLSAELHIGGEPVGIGLAVKCPYIGDDGTLSTGESPVVRRRSLDIPDDIFGVSEAAKTLADFLLAHAADIYTAVKGA